MPAETKKRVRRTADQLIADLEAKIQNLRIRAQTKVAKKSPTAKVAIKTLRGIDKGLQVAEAEGDRELAFALSDARKPLAGWFANKGLLVPKAKIPRGRRPAALATVS